jgi:hypothetical protein
MPSLEQIRASIEARLAELSTELITLENARAALYSERSASRTTRSSTNGAAGPRRRRTPASTRHQRGGAPRNRASAEVVAEAPGKSLTEVVKPPLRSPGSRPRTPAKRAKAAKAIDVLVADKLETILQGEGEGLSAVTITERSNASYRQVLDLLRELENAGRVRRTGTRRSTLWRLITDEERIAERAAELKRRTAKSGR